jgi:hypothetical protein
MKFRSLAFALALTFGVTGLAEAKKKPVAANHKFTKGKVSKPYNAKKANKQAQKQLAKMRKKRAA